MIHHNIPIPTVRRVDDPYGYRAAFERHDRLYIEALMRKDFPAADRHYMARKALAREVQ